MWFGEWIDGGGWKLIAWRLHSILSTDSCQAESTEHGCVAGEAHDELAELGESSNSEQFCESVVVDSDFGLEDDSFVLDGFCEVEVNCGPNFFSEARWLGDYLLMKEVMCVFSFSA